LPTKECKYYFQWDTRLFAVTDVHICFTINGILWQIAKRSSGPLSIWYGTHNFYYPNNSYHTHPLIIQFHLEICHITKQEVWTEIHEVERNPDTYHIIITVSIISDLLFFLIFVLY